jgi:hypothetical protein
MTITIDGMIGYVHGEIASITMEQMLFMLLVPGILKKTLESTIAGLVGRD